jgi:protein TonB
VRRLVVAAVLSLAAHGILLAANPQWLRGKPPVSRPERIVTLTLSARMPAAREEAASAEASHGMAAARQPPESPEQRPPEERRAAREAPATERAAKDVPPTPEKGPRRALPPLPELPGTAGAVASVGFPAPVPEIGKRALRPLGGAEKGPGTPAQGSRDAVPLYAENPPPPYPGLARRRGYEGTVLLEVLVDRHGQVATLRVIQSSGYAVLDRAAMTSVERWRFKAGMRAGQPVGMWVRVPIRFQLE